MGRKKKQSIGQLKGINKTSKKKAKLKKLKQVGEILREEVDNANSDFRNFHEEMISSKASAKQIDIKNIEIMVNKEKDSKNVTDEELQNFTEKLMGL